MNKPLTALGSALLIATASPAFSASTADLAVIGSITPSACALLISGGGMVDFGQMPAKELNADQHTRLPNHSMQLSVRCEAPTFFTLSTIDNRAGSSAHHDHWHGLGMTSAGEQLGGAGFNLHDPVADGVSAVAINSLDGGVTWRLGNFLTHNALTAVTVGFSDLTPIAVRDFDAVMWMSTHIAPTAGLTLSDAVPVDGHATVQLKYL